MTFQSDPPAANLWYRTVLDSVRAPVLVESRERIIYINDAYLHVLGYQRPEELVNRHISCVVAETDRERLNSFTNLRDSDLVAPVQYPFLARRRDGSVIGLTARVSTARAEGRLLITTVAEVQEKRATAPSPRTLEVLSMRERQVFDLLLLGNRPKEIARLLDISGKTVSTHRSNLCSKLGFESIRDLFRFAWESELLSKGSAQAAD